MKISLINMPFAATYLPSIALVQLEAIIAKAFPERVSTELIYLNQEFAKLLGLEFYKFISTLPESQNAGLGDWFFRQIAYPELDDNEAEYFRRFFPYKTNKFELFKRQILEKRKPLDRFLEKLITKYSLDKRELVGFTSMFSQNMAIFALARKLKERAPNVITVMGGANCETPMGQEIAKNVPYIDYVFSGPALKSFPLLISNLLEKNSANCHQIKGIFTRSNVRFQMLGGTIGEELNIDETLPLNYQPFINNIEQNFPKGEVKPVLLFETSRGCWWGERAHCTFCGLNGQTMTYRAMQAEKAIEQISSLFRYSSKVERFESVDNIMPKNYLQDVFPKISTPMGSYIFYEVKADLDENDMQVLSQARVKVVQPGIEALSTPVLKLMKKGTTAFQNIKFLKNCVLFDIFPVWNLLVGFPGEDESVYEKYFVDLPLLAHLPPPNGAFPVRFDRYSPYFVKSAEYGLELQPVDYYEMCYPFSKQSLANFAYYFQDCKVDSKYVTSMTQWIHKIRNKIDYWLNRWHQLDKLIPPKLFFKNNSTLIEDSRTGTVTIYDVGEIGKQILSLINNRPLSPSSIAGNLRLLNEDSMIGEIERLKEFGLIFQEGDRLLSLVLDREPSLNSVLSD